MRLVDSHCHLQDERILSDVEGVLARARAMGVERFCVCGSSPADWEPVRQLAQAHPAVIPFFGVHPWYVRDLEHDWKERLSAYLDEGAGGIGEIGLDDAVENRDMVRQEGVFIRQLAMAQHRGLPVQIHCRRAWGRMTELLDHVSPDAHIMIHSFSGSQEMVRQWRGRNIYFSFSGSITRSGNNRGHKALQAVPIDRLMIETDAPDIPMVIDHRIDPDTPNEPANLIHVLHQAAQLRSATPEALGEQLWSNHLAFMEKHDQENRPDA